MSLEEICCNGLLLRFLFEFWKPFHARRNHSTSPGPFLVDQKLDHSSNRPKRYAFDGGVEKSQDNHSLGLAVSQSSRHKVEDLFLVHLAHGARVGRLHLIRENLKARDCVGPRLLAKDHRLLSQIGVCILGLLTDLYHFHETRTRT